MCKTNFYKICLLGIFLICGLFHVSNAEMLFWDTFETPNANEPVDSSLWSQIGDANVTVTTNDASQGSKSAYFTQDSNSHCIRSSTMTKYTSFWVDAQINLDPCCTAALVLVDANDSAENISVTLYIEDQGDGSVAAWVNHSGGTIWVIDPNDPEPLPNWQRWVIGVDILDEPNGEGVVTVGLDGEPRKVNAVFAPVTSGTVPSAVKVYGDAQPVYVDAVKLYDVNPLKYLFKDDFEGEDVNSPVDANLWIQTDNSNKIIVENDVSTPDGTKAAYFSALGSGSHGIYADINYPHETLWVDAKVYLDANYGGLITFEDTDGNTVAILDVNANSSGIYTACVRSNNDTDWVIPASDNEPTVGWERWLFGVTITDEANSEGEYTVWRDGDLLAFNVLFATYDTGALPARAKFSSSNRSFYLDDLKLYDLSPGLVPIFGDDFESPDANNPVDSAKWEQVSQVISILTTDQNDPPQGSQSARFLANGVQGIYSKTEGYRDNFFVDAWIYLPPAQAAVLSIVDNNGMEVAASLYMQDVSGNTVVWIDSNETDVLVSASDGKDYTGWHHWIFGVKSYSSSYGLYSAFVDSNCLAESASYYPKGYSSGLRTRPAKLKMFSSTLEWQVDDVLIYDERPLQSLYYREPKDFDSNVAYGCEVDENNGGIDVNVGSVLFPIGSWFSKPGGGLYKLGYNIANNWTPTITEVSATQTTIDVDSGNYSLHRVIDELGNRIEVSDTFTNTGASLKDGSEYRDVNQTPDPNKWTFSGTTEVLVKADETPPEGSKYLEFFSTAKAILGKTVDSDYTTFDVTASIKPDVNKAIVFGFWDGAGAKIWAQIYLQAIGNQYDAVLQRSGGSDTLIEDQNVGNWETWRFRGWITNSSTGAGKYSVWLDGNSLATDVNVSPYSANCNAVDQFIAYGTGAKMDDVNFCGDANITVGIRFGNEIHLTGDNNSTIAGQDYLSTISTSAAERPHVHVIKSGEAVGMVARDTVYRNHAALYKTTGSENTYGIRDEYLALEPNASYTVKWEVYPRPGDEDEDYYFDFINTIRSTWQTTDSTIPSLFSGTDPNCLWYIPDTNTWTAWKDLSSSELERSLELFNSNLHWYITTYDDYPREAFGGTYLTDANEAKAAISTMRSHVNDIDPNIKSLVYFHQGLDWTPHSDGNMLGCRRLDVNLNQELYWADANWGMYYATPTNPFGSLMQTVFDEMLTNFTGGIYWDEYTFSSPQRYVYQPNEWDGYSAIIDDNDNTVAQKVSSLGLITQAWRIAAANEVKIANKYIVSNFFPTCDEEMSLNQCHFVEYPLSAYPPEWTRPHLTCPLAYEKKGGLTTGPVMMEYASKYLMKGLILGVLSGSTNFSSTWSTNNQRIPVGYFFPITPVELHSGYVIGDECILTTVSGIYGFDDSNDLEVTIIGPDGYIKNWYEGDYILRDNKTYYMLDLAKYEVAVIRYRN
ncbi:MAG: hypothetical protein ABIG61_12565 [Planctomycetota bacterium]